MQDPTLQTTDIIHYCNTHTHPSTISSQTIAECTTAHHSQQNSVEEELASAALNHRLRSSGSTVVTMTSKVNGKMENSTPCRSETP